MRGKGSAHPGPPRSREELMSVLRDNDFVISRVATYYGKARQQVYRWLNRYEIDVDNLRGRE